MRKRPLSEVLEVLTESIRAGKHQEQLALNVNNKTENTIRDFMSRKHSDAIDAFLDVTISGIIRILPRALKFQVENGKRDWRTVLLPYFPGIWQKSIEDRDVLIPLRKYCENNGLTLSVKVVSWKNEYTGSGCCYIEAHVSW